MCCLWPWIGCRGQFPRHPASGEGVLWSLLVGWWPLDVWPVSVDVLPVVSTLDTLPACEPVPWCLCGCAACGCQFPRWCWLSVSDGVPQFQR